MQVLCFSNIALLWTGFMAEGGFMVEGVFMAEGGFMVEGGFMAIFSRRNCPTNSLGYAANVRGTVRQSSSRLCLSACALGVANRSAV